MDKTEFWELIESAKTRAKGNQNLQEQLLISSLAKRSPEQIIEFECILREYLIAADDFGILAAQKIIDGYVTDDSYLYFRCWLIGEGQQVYQNALRAPDTLAAVVEEAYLDFEALLVVADSAFEECIGQEAEAGSSPRDIALARGLDYDSGSETKGEDWTENQLPKLLPKLWKKFGAA
ncbi:DUF4240 domain-containing protein [Hymenobacter metallilatus]|nr:DUF4240 domain-containing protein [Hymenobacter metallilatus]